MDAGLAHYRPNANGGEPLASADQVVQVRDVTLQYKTPDHLVTATYKVSCAVERGDRYVILGPSGCGKSTLLKAVAGFIQPVAGSITVNERQVTGPGPDRIMVFQDFEQLMPWKTVRQNILFPMKMTGKYRGKDAEERVRRAIDTVKLTKFADVYPHMLSGGMKMRVAIARAMALEPDVLLMDEPFAALDALTRRNMQEELLALWDQLKFTMLFVTHSIEEAIVVGSRILILSPHPGRVRAELDAGDLRYADVDSPAFGALSKRIQGLLFGASMRSEAGHVGK